MPTQASDSHSVPVAHTALSASTECTYPLKTHQIINTEIPKATETFSFHQESGLVRALSVKEGHFKALARVLLGRVSPATSPLSMEQNSFQPQRPAHCTHPHRTHSTLQTRAPQTRGCLSEAT